LPLAAVSETWAAPPVALAAIPLRAADRVAGVLGVYHAQRALDPRGLELLERAAPIAGLQLEHALEYGRVRDSAERDPLTGLLNRRGFERRLADEAARFDRYAQSIGLLLIDIDHFKRINDTWGHDAGDDVLRTVAATIAAGIRDVDDAVRFGGEEFAVLLPSTGHAAARD